MRSDGRTASLPQRVSRDRRVGQGLGRRFQVPKLQAPNKFQASMDRGNSIKGQIGHVAIIDGAPATPVRSSVTPVRGPATLVRSLATLVRSLATLVSSLATLVSSLARPVSSLARPVSSLARP